MNDARRTKHWKVVEVQLRQAAEFLQEPERVALEDRELSYYIDYEDDGRFIAQMDELAAAALEYGCKSGFWRRIQKPAVQMGPMEKVAEYERRFHEALRRDA